MQTNTRNKILETARVLFEQKGYNGVSIKTIADAVGISTGNLTYYFKQKEDLAEALVAQQHTMYRKLDVPDSLSKLHDYFLDIIEVQKRNAYYYKHYTQFSQISPKIKQYQRDVYEDIRAALNDALVLMAEDDIVDFDAIPEQRERSIDTIMILCVGAQFDERVDRLACMWNVVFPLLTERGKLLYCNK